MCGLVLLGVTMVACAGEAAQKRGKPATGATTGQTTGATTGQTTGQTTGATTGKKTGAKTGQTTGATTGQTGKATYYSPRLAGRKTASGEPYDPAKFTAAHPTLPLGTRVRVTRLDGGSKSVVVRINDRCAGVKKIIDLSEAAARRLDMMRAGIVPVRLVPINAN